MPPPADEIDIPLFDMVLCFSRAIDFLHPQISEHHLGVAYVASCPAEGLGLDCEETQNVLIAGALHSFEDALAYYHDSSPQFSDDLHQHGREGYLLLRDFTPFAEAAQAIRFHH